MTNDKLAWADNFPPIYGHTSISFLKGCPGFKEAKTGNMEAAAKVIESCVKQKRIDELKNKYPNAVLLPVITNNKLPLAFAEKIDMKIHIGAYAIKEINRKNLPAMERLTNRPAFVGEIKEGLSYIIVDDIVTQGGTVSALRKYVGQCNSRVLAVTALAFSADSRVIAPTYPEICQLIDKFSYEFITGLIRQYNIADNVWELTGPQVRYLLCFKCSGSILHRLKRAS